MSPHPPAPSSVVLNQYIVELSASSENPPKRTDAGSRPHDRVYTALGKRGVGFRVDKEYHVEGIFSGMALTLHKAEDVVTLQSIPEIESAEPVALYRVPETQPVETVEEYIAAVSASYNPNPTHRMAGVDKVHAKGNSGGNIRIGLIDTGVDYTHPSFGGMGPGHTIVGGWDFVGDEYNGNMQTMVPDPDPMDCNGHGTHVAGIIGASPDGKYNITGVAFSSSITMYKVFGCNAQTDATVILDAMLRAFEEHQDIISMSLGFPGGWSQSKLASVAARISAAGTVVVASIGNQGQVGPFYGAEPATGLGVISAGSVENRIVPASKAAVGGVDHPAIPYFSIPPFDHPDSLPVYVPQFEAGEWGCKMTGDVSDLSQYAVLVEKTDEYPCTAWTQWYILLSNNATITLSYGGDDPYDQENRQAPMIPVEDGKWLASQVSAGVPVTLSFPTDALDGGHVNLHGGLASDFSSWGPSNEMHLMPRLVAPGGRILSIATGDQYGPHAVMSGTSMAAPFIAGCAALLLASERKPSTLGEDVVKRLQNTARRVPISHEKDALWEPLPHQGAGLVNIYDAIYGTTTVSKSELLLNDTMFFKDTHTFTVTNDANTSQEYTLLHSPAGTVLTTLPGSSRMMAKPSISDALLGVNLSHDNFTLGSGESLTVTVHFSLPESNDPSTFPLYSGQIDIASAQDNVHVSYLGLGAASKDRKVLDEGSLPSGIIVPTISTPSYPKPDNVFTWASKNDYPVVQYSLTFGSRFLTLDLVSESFSLLNNQKAAGDVARRAESLEEEEIYLSPLQSARAGTFSSVETLGAIAEGTYLFHNTENNVAPISKLFIKTPTFSNGTVFPKGRFRLLLRVLRTFGDVEEQEDYDSWVSPVVTFAH